MSVTPLCIEADDVNVVSTNTNKIDNKKYSNSFLSKKLKLKILQLAAFF